MQQHPLCEVLRVLVADHVEPVQQGFDAYQQAAFIARPPEFFCLELCGEAGELANLEKKLWKGRDIAHADLADEAADIFIALMNYCNARGIDLSHAVANKLLRIKSTLDTSPSGDDHAHSPSA
jgi:NTP pyrophosphatase (non-canonical NTP hydrolase)